MKQIKYLAILLILMSACNTPTPPTPHIVFVMGDEEYRSEESMPMLSKIIEREMSAKVTLCYPLDSAGFIDPNRLDHIEGLEALEDADLMVLFTRFRALPKKEMQYIVDYAESGRPMVGFRTSTHAFLYKEDSTLQPMNNEWPTQVFGQQWVTHHGHFEDGNAPLTEVTVLKDEHPILNGVKPFNAYSWLYHVDGGDWNLNYNGDLLLQGKSLRSNHANNDRLDQFPLTNPVAWTKTYTGESGTPARVFFTTLGHPYDFKEASMRKLAANGIYWALGMEEQLPDDGVKVDFVESYDPNNSGFGQKFKQGRKP